MLSPSRDRVSVSNVRGGVLHGLQHDTLPAPPRLRSFRIGSAETAQDRTSASILIDRMYATRGYQSAALADLDCSSRKTFLAWDPIVAVGTLTIRVDTAVGLHVDELFSSEVTRIRDAGRGVCEFTKLAMDRRARSPRLLASMFHVAYLFAYQVRGLRHLFIEVNPRHVRYYETMLGFQVVCEPVHNPRVNAPAVLMVLDLQHAEDQISRFAGQPSKSSVTRSAYPFFFSPDREQGIVRSIEQRDPEIASVYEPDVSQIHALARQELCH